MRARRKKSKGLFIEFVNRQLPLMQSLFEEFQIREEDFLAFLRHFVTHKRFNSFLQTGKKPHKKILRIILNVYAKRYRLKQIFGWEQGGQEMMELEKRRLLLEHLQKDL